MTVVMTTADWALLVSIFSFLVSLSGFVWNVWSKFIYPKARVRTSISLMVIFDDVRPISGHTIILQATNYGPTDITLHCAVAAKRVYWGRRDRKGFGLINPITHPEVERTQGPFTGFPKKLTVGESGTSYFNADAPLRWISEAKLFYYGFADTFGRYHWCSRRNAMQFRADIAKHFGFELPPEGLQKSKLQAAAIVTAAQALARLHRNRSAKKSHRLNRFKAPWNRGR